MDRRCLLINLNVILFKDEVSRIGLHLKIPILIKALLSKFVNWARAHSDLGSFFEGVKL